MQVNDAIWLLLMAFMVALLFFIIWFLSYTSLQQTYSVNGLNEANRLALYDGIDYASRGQRGVFYLDMNKYKSALSRLQIKRFGNQTLNVGRNGNCTILVLPDMVNDKSALLHTSQIYDKNSYPQHLANKWERASLVTNDDNTNDVAIRGILIATKFTSTKDGTASGSTKLERPDGDIDTPSASHPKPDEIGAIFGKTDSHHNNIDPNLYVSAELVNTYGRPTKGSYNPYDTENDISR